jgi:hypothetical protein
MQHQSVVTAYEHALGKVHVRPASHKCFQLDYPSELGFVSIFTINTGKPFYRNKFRSRSFMNGFRRDLMVQNQRDVI